MQKERMMGSGVDLLFSSCLRFKEPTFDPFDSDFNFDISQLICASNVELPAGCGYINLTKAYPDHHSYYQVLYEDDAWNVVAKGLYMDLPPFHFDSLPTANVDGDSLIQLAQRMPIDTIAIDRVLSTYGLMPFFPDTAVSNRFSRFYLDQDSVIHRGNFNWDPDGEQLAVRCSFGFLISPSKRGNLRPIESN